MFVISDINARKRLDLFRVIQLVWFQRGPWGHLMLITRSFSWNRSLIYYISIRVAPVGTLLAQQLCDGTLGSCIGIYPKGSWAWLLQACSLEGPGAPPPPSGHRAYLILANEHLASTPPWGWSTCASSLPCTQETHSRNLRLRGYLQGIT